MIMTADRIEPAPRLRYTALGLRARPADWFGPSAFWPILVPRVARPAFIGVNVASPLHVLLHLMAPARGARSASIPALTEPTTALHCRADVAGGARALGAREVSAEEERASMASMRPWVA
jgi:hypothetical protein